MVSFLGVSMEFEECKRHRITVDNENFYVIIGEKFIDIKGPYEHRPENKKLWETLHQICEGLTSILKGE